MRRALPHLSALVCGVAAALIVGCSGQSNLVPAGDAQTLKDQLAQVKQAVDAGDCTAAASALAQARQTALGLPATVDRRLRQRVDSGVKALENTVPRDCRAAAQPTVTTPPVTTPTDTTPTDTTPTDTTPTDTTPTDTTPTDTTPTDTTPTDTTTTPPAATTTTPSSPSGGTGVPTP